EEALWPVHPLDQEEDDPEPLLAPTGLYLGASGVVWALDELARVGAVEPGRDWQPVAAGLHERYLAHPDFGQAVPSLFVGESGILLVAHRLTPSAEQEERLLACVLANVDNPTRELLWGSPGTMLAAQVMHERTGDERWAEAWRESADWLWDDWRDELWQQE